MSVIKLNSTQVKILSNVLSESVARNNMPRILIESEDGNSISLHVKTEEPKSFNQSFYLEIYPTPRFQERDNQKEID